MKAECKCGNACICDDDGRYSMEKIRTRDPAWEQLINRGLRWQVLSWKVMLEPGAVVVITNALNLKNSTALEVGQGEIFRYMCTLTNPWPQPTYFEPIRDQLIRMYGTEGQDPNLLGAFQFIMEAGGKDSPHMTDYKDVIAMFVDGATLPDVTCA